MKVGIRPNDDDSCGWYHVLPAPAPSTTWSKRRSPVKRTAGAGAGRTWYQPQESSSFGSMPTFMPAS